MPFKYRFEDTLANMFESFRRQIQALPLNLGGTAASGGGTGGPPGGYAGHLPQTRVSYDITEASSSGIPSPIYSGTLVDNLDHIRYRLDVVESSGGGSSVIHIYGEDLTSQIPASGNEFTVLSSYTSGTLNVHYNGIRQNKDYYTEDYAAGTFITDFAPISGDEITADYHEE